MESKAKGFVSWLGKRELTSTFVAGQPTPPVTYPPEIRV